MSEISRFLSTHRAIVTLQKGYSLVPTQKYGLFLILLLRYIGSKQGILVPLPGLNLFALLKSRVLIQSLISKTAHLVYSHNKLISDLSALQHSFTTCTQSLLEKAHQISAETAEVQKITGVIVTLREGITNLFKAEKEERRELCTLFQEIRQENIETKSAIDHRLGEFKETTKELASTLRTLFSPLSEFNERLKNTGGEMDQLANIIEQIVNNS